MNYWVKRTRLLFLTTEVTLIGLLNSSSLSELVALGTL
nr:hypothetical protein Iba_chr08aCG1800 [Ipomoea batatas]GMD24497.1 hypothetical protein Iba_chr08cCG1230 [Ipomoea batatas]GMD26050.1 hypothetical protein Iba_chr08dCG0560 [Ipomoea batatas]